MGVTNQIMIRLSTLVAAMSCGAVMTSPGIAAAEVEIGATGGVHIFNQQNELGVQDVPNAPSARNSLLLGLRIGAFFNSVLGVEGELGVIPTVARDFEYSLTSLTYRAHLVAQFRAARPENVFIPFVFAGGGAFSVVSSNNGMFMTDTTRIEEDTDAALYAGVGAKFRLGERFGVRLDARLLMVPSSDNPDRDPDDSRVTQDFEALGSIYLAFGRGATKPADRPAPSDDDPDKDGVRGALDQCPREPEDMDSFQDDDGCPEPDNDADGVLDGVDACVNEAEDKDGFQDDDGCPDEDNDGDGVLDGADTCIDQPETKNGYQDEDGCPDEVPEKVRAFTGVIQGINFRVNSSQLLPISNRTLDKAVAVLEEFPALELEIQGHTDDLAIKKGGKFADNLALSQARAETVRAYFIQKGIAEARLSAKGYGDTKPVESPAGLKGRKLTNARAKNRRVEFQLISRTPSP